MNRNLISIVSIGIITLVLVAWMLMSPTHTDNRAHENEHGETRGDEIVKGSHGGRILQQDEFSLEITIFETGVAPEFRVYAYADNQPLSPELVDLEIELSRLDGTVDRIGFGPQGNFLRGNAAVYEPHSFEVAIKAKHRDKSYRWQYENFEGRTQIGNNMAQELGIRTEAVGPVDITEVRTFTGSVHTDPDSLSRVRPRFPGVVKAIRHGLGDRVKAGDILATVQSNDSLRNYSIKAPISGQIIHRDLQIGEATGDAPLFVIADLSSVWVELDVFNRDLALIQKGQPVSLESLDGKPIRQATIHWISPLAAHATQSARARVVVPNGDGVLRPGQFIRGHVTVATSRVPLGIRMSAIQRFRDFQVVFARFGETYEVRMLQLGRKNTEWAEVLGGIRAGTQYVTENSYLIKADIEKSGASHDH